MIRRAEAVARTASNTADQDITLVSVVEAWVRIGEFGRAEATLRFIAGHSAVIRAAVSLCNGLVGAGQRAAGPGSAPAGSRG